MCSGDWSSDVRSSDLDNTDESQPDPYNQDRTGSPSRHQNGVVTLQHIFSPHFLNAAVGGISRTHATDSLDVSALDPIAANTSLGDRKAACSDTVEYWI